MATNEVPRGPISDYVTENVKRLRAARRLSLAELSEEMTRAGRPMLASGLHRLEQGKRRVDCDDLVGLAIALDVSPITLLMPWSAHGEVELTDKVRANLLEAWDWMRGLRPLSWSVEQIAERLAPLPEGVTDEDSDTDVEEYVSARFRLTAVPKGARSGEARGAEREERLRQNADVRDGLRDHLREQKAARGLGGEHSEAP
jgi:transcriptional regulator with XRE-family HTH domain